MDTDPNTRFIQELGYHGFAFGSEPSAVEDDLVEDVARYIAAPTAPAGSGIDLHDLDPQLSPRAACLALIAGARHAAAKAREIEVAAARIARLLQPPVTVRELANQAGITERAAATRYPNPLNVIPVSSRKGSAVKMPPLLLPRDVAEILGSDVPTWDLGVDTEGRTARELFGDDSTEETGV
ncbi:hypothetical protein [Mycolicibacterium conceptionense]|uniref:hypothetical protein n=1 Tax=Mycolicibacterium conceptionense TaxID=451644 RepID=UPI003204E9EF